MLLVPTYTLAEANALVPYIADEVARLRTAFGRLREIATASAPTSLEGAGVTPAVAAPSADERAVLEATVAGAIEDLFRAGATVRLDPPGVEVHARNEEDGEPVRLHFVEGADAFTLWRDADDRLHEIDDPDDFGAAVTQ